MHAHAARQSTALWPPNPNEFDIAERRGPPLRAASGRARAGHVVQVEILVGLLVAERRRRDALRSASTVAIASTAPAAPSRWPIADFVDETGTRCARSPSAALIASVSARSFSGVEVPWALT